MRPAYRLHFECVYELLFGTTLDVGTCSVGATYSVPLARDGKLR